MGVLGQLISTVLLFRFVSTVQVPACDSQIYCQGPLLQEIQMAELFKDSKTFVDMHMKYNPDVVLSAFSNLTNPTKDELRVFVETYFDGPGTEFGNWTPSDFVQNPAFLQNIRDPQLQTFGRELCGIWTHLGRQIKKDIKDNQQRYSLIYLPNPFIVPGGRFREIFYWDSYWVIKGLLTCEMYTTVKGMLENLLSFIDTYGMIPNGGRVYFTKRSQPPLMIPMVYLYVQATNDTSFITNHINTLEKEYSFWATKRNVTVIADSGKMHTLNRYATPITVPRPESYKEDYRTAQGLSKEDAANLYSNLASGAESGWDFSSRWFTREDASSTVADTIVKDILPVDLNSILCWNEKLLSDFFNTLGDSVKSERYQSLSQSRIEAIADIMWNNEDGVWYDFNFKTKTQRRHFYPSNVFPLYVGCQKSIDSTDYEARVRDYLQGQGIFEFDGGVPTSLVNTTQQWDYPNGWPPLQEIVVTALDNGNTIPSHQKALGLVKKWIYSNWKGWNRTKHMFEKYSVLQIGSRGGGGEYDVQEGFGWSNGVVLDFLSRFGAEFTLSEVETDMTTCDSSTCGGQSLNLVTTALLLNVCSCIIVYFRMF